MIFPYPVPVGTCCGVWGRQVCRRSCRIAPTTLALRRTRPSGRRRLTGFTHRLTGTGRSCGAGPGHGPERGSQCGSLLPQRIRAPVGSREARGPPAHQVTRDSGLSGGPLRPRRQTAAAAAQPPRRRPPSGRIRANSGEPARRTRAGRALGTRRPIRAGGPGRASVVRGRPGGSLQWILMVRVAASRPFFERKAVPPWA